eukprot:8049118-Ditylum_brightwellii.AAC.1
MPKTTTTTTTSASSVTTVTTIFFDLIPSNSESEGSWDEALEDSDTEDEMEETAEETEEPPKKKQEKEEHKSTGKTRADGMNLHKHCDTIKSTEIEQVQWLQDIITIQDKANNGASRSEVLDIIGEISGVFDRRKCSNHYDYLIHSGCLPELKGSGKVCTAQAIDTDCSQITVVGQHCFI